VGETINVMTLGGLALAVGILVDDATVTIENIERHLHMGADLHTAILEGAGEIAIPAFVATLCICIVFVPMFFLEGVARYLFVPLAEAVVFAMLASYVLSRTLVPTLALLLMGHQGRSGRVTAWIHHVHQRFNHQFEKLRSVYVLLLSHLLTHRRRFMAGFLASACCPAACTCYWGATCSPRWIPARSSCTCARPPAPASKTPPGWPMAWTVRCGKSFRRTSWTPSSTISACPIPASICPTATPAPSARWTRTS
jgi:Cu/Ag efflux pump CusA